MRLLIVTNIHSPLHANASNGMERSSHEFLLLLANYIRHNNLDIDVHVFTNRDSVVPEMFKVLRNVPIKINKDYAKYGDGVNKWDLYSFEMQVLGSTKLFKKYSVIHDMSSLFSFPFIASNLNIPYVRTIRLMPYHPVYSLTKNFTDYFILLSNYQAAFMTDFLSRRKVIRDPIIIDYPISKKNDFGYCVSVSRIEKRKGIEMSVKVANKIGLKLVLVGERMDEDYIAELYQNEYHSQIEFRGKLEKAETLHIIFNASYLIWTPNFPEPTGRVIVEALKLKTKVLALNVGNATDIIGANNLQPVFEIDGQGMYELDHTHLFQLDSNHFMSEHINVYQSLLK